MLRYPYVCAIEGSGTDRDVKTTDLAQYTFSAYKRDSIATPVESVSFKVNTEKEFIQTWKSSLATDEYAFVNTLKLPGREDEPMEIYYNVNAEYTWISVLLNVAFFIIVVGIAIEAIVSFNFNIFKQVVYSL